MKEITIEEIKRRLMLRGYEADELTTLFKTEKQLRDFYYETFLKAKKIGNDLSKEESKSKVNYTLTAAESKQIKAIEAAKKKQQKRQQKQQQQQKAVKLPQQSKTGVNPVAPKNAPKETLEQAGAHLGKEAGTMSDFERIMSQIEQEEE